MTILHQFLDLAESTAQHLKDYLQTRDFEALQAASHTMLDVRTLLVNEQSDPQVQETSIVIDADCEENVLLSIDKDNALVLRDGEYVADGPIIERRLIRVHVGSQILIFKVTAMINVPGDSRVILAPVPGI